MSTDIRCTLSFDGDALVIVPTSMVSTVLGLADHPDLTDERLRDITRITVNLQGGKLFSFQAYLDLAVLARRHRRQRPTADRLPIVTDRQLGEMRRCAETLGLLNVLTIELSPDAPLTERPSRRRRRKE